MHLHIHSKEVAHIPIFKSQNISNASHALNNAPSQPPAYVSNTSDVKEAHLDYFPGTQTWDVDCLWDVKLFTGNCQVQYFCLEILSLLTVTTSTKCIMSSAINAKSCFYFQMHTNLF